MPSPQVATLQAIHARADAAGRRVAEVRTKGGSDQEMAAAIAALEAIQNESMDFCAAIGFRVVKR